MYILYSLSEKSCKRRRRTAANLSLNSLVGLMQFLRFCRRLYLLGRHLSQTGNHNNTNMVTLFVNSIYYILQSGLAFAVFQEKEEKLEHENIVRAKSFPCRWCNDITMMIWWSFSRMARDNIMQTAWQC